MPRLTPCSKELKSRGGGWHVISLEDLIDVASGLRAAWAFDPRALYVAQESFEDLSLGEPGVSWEHCLLRDVLLIHRYPRVRGLFENPLGVSRKSGPFLEVRDDKGEKSIF